MELYSQLVKDRRQLTYYNSGIGTYASPSWKSFAYLKQALENKIDLAIAWWVLKYFVVLSPLISHCRTFERIVISAYRWLAENYTPGDRIFLFGKRVLAIMSIMSINWIPIRIFSWCLSSPRPCRHDREGEFEPNFCLCDPNQTVFRWDWSTKGTRIKFRCKSPCAFMLRHDM